MAYSHWIYNCTPEKGDNVQVDCKHKLTDKRTTFEGVIAGRIGNVLWFTHELPVFTSEWCAIRWRHILDSDTTETEHRIMEEA